MIIKDKYSIPMTCASCENNIKKALKDLAISVNVNVPLDFAYIEYDDEKTSSTEIIAKIKSVGYDAELTD